MDNFRVSWLTLVSFLIFQYKVCETKMCNNITSCSVLTLCFLSFSFSHSSYFPSLTRKKWCTLMSLSTLTSGKFSHYLGSLHFLLNILLIFFPFIHSVSQWLFFNRADKYSVNIPYKMNRQTSEKTVPYLSTV